MARKARKKKLTQEEKYAWLRQLVDRAKAGDTSAVPMLREMLDANPCLWKLPGNVAVQAQAAWVERLAGPDLHLRECAVRWINQLKLAVGGPSPAPLESLLVERVVMATLQLAYVESTQAQQPGDLRWAEFQLKRQAQAERQLRAAIDALQTLRRTAKPIMVELRQPAVAPVPEPIVAAPGNGEMPPVINGTASKSVPANAERPLNGHGDHTPKPFAGANRVGGKLREMFGSLAGT